MDTPENTNVEGPPSAGFVAVLGAPNAGKSTFINQVVGAKVSIVSAKVQTTRTRVLGIMMSGQSQLIFIDTPGIFNPRKRLDRAMVAAAWGGASDADTVMLIVDCATGYDQNTQKIVAGLKSKKRKAILVLNKVDLIDKPKLLDLTTQMNDDEVFTDVFMISALKGQGVDELVAHFAKTVPEGPWMFPPDQISDMPARLLAAEITREQVYHQLHQELPYAATVETESWEEKKDGSVAINQVIYVERDTQKGIVLGKGGAKIKSISSAARHELAEILDQKVHLMLFVKVRANWGDDPDRYSDWGLDFQA
ncbi:MAG: GTPase Era [Rhodospirillales bacterium]|nr:GTPase Era [Rhodospirillales bacterium]